jgi:hypothetical protein
MNKKYLDLLRWGLIEIVKSILTKISNYGLDGKQNLIIRFYNHFDSTYLFEDQFTTVTLQNNNQELYCNEDGFSLNIKINGVNKRITVPFDAVALILDPSARFGLELGQVFDEYKISTPKHLEKSPEKIKFINHQTVVFNENTNYDKYYYSQDHEYQIDYIEITRYYLINVIKQLLSTLLPHSNDSDEGFFIEFKKNYPGVIIPNGLNIKNEDLIIVSLKEKFFNLTVEENEMTVILSFNNQLQKVVIPYKAITNFFDPNNDFKIDLSFIDFIDEKILEQNENKITYVEF